MLTTEPASDRRRLALRRATRDYLGQIARNRTVAVPALLLPGLGNIFAVYLPPLVVARVLDAYARHGSGHVGLRLLAPYLVLFGLVWMGGEVFWRVGIHCLNRMDSRGIEQLYLDGMEALLAKDLAFFQDNFAGSITKKVVSYAKSFEEFGDTVSFRIVSSFLPLIFVSVVLWRFSPLLPLTLLGWMAVTVVIVTPLIRRRQALVDEREEAGNRTAGHVADSITNMEAVRAFAREPFEFEVHRRNVRHYTRLMLRSWDYHNRVIDLVTMPLYVLTNLSGVVIAVLVGGDGLVGLRTVFVTFTYYAAFTRVLWDFNQIYRGLESNLTEAAQFTELLLDDPTVVDVTEPEPLRQLGSSVVFDRVSFRYPGTSKALFTGLDLRVADGEKVGLVGRSGGGKSTITRLLLRLMDVDGGRILIGGQDIARLRQADARSLVSYVPQEPLMFHRSLRDNIAFGRLDATEDEVREAAHAAHAAEFIEQLPEGYDTLVGERGIKLSGGQRQRVAIARAIVRRAPILVLDEATSSLDSESEALIQRALATLMDRSTSLVIAHRLSTVQQMDRLVVLEQGHVVEEGPHRALVGAGGIYADLWARQSGGFLVDVEDAPASVS